MSFSYHIVILNVVKNLNTLIGAFRFFAMLRMTRHNDSDFAL